MDQVAQIEVEIIEDTAVFRIPRLEQLKFPFHKNVSFSLGFYWTNSRLDTELDHANTVF